MSANTDMIFSKAGDLQAVGPITAVGSPLHSGAGTIGTDIFKVWKAGADGGYVDHLRVEYVSDGTTASVACIMKFFACTTDTGAVTNANSWYIGKIALPATGALSATAAVPDEYIVPIGIQFNPTYTILAKITVAQTNANSGWMVTAVAGKN